MHVILLIILIILQFINCKAINILDIMLRVFIEVKKSHKMFGTKTLFNHHSNQVDQYRFLF